MDVSPAKGFSSLFNGINGDVMESYRGGNLNPFVITLLVVVLFFYLVMFNSLGSYASEGQPQVPGAQTMNLMEIMMWGIFIFLLLINGLQYFFKIDVKTAVKNLWTTPEVDVEVKGLDADGDGEEDVENGPKQHTHVKHKPQKEVFHIKRNIYSYDDAKAVCKAHGAKLANYSQIETAYNNGAEWCGYGWSSDQMGLFPTQKETWEKMQKEKGCKDGGGNHDCGRPGINGGYFDNPNLKLGVNCWGVKRKAFKREEDRLNKHQIGPKSKDECKFDEKVNEYKKRIQDFRMSSWNTEKWKSPDYNHGYDIDDIEKEMAAKQPKEIVHTHKSHKHVIPGQQNASPPEPVRTKKIEKSTGMSMAELQKASRERMEAQRQAAMGK